MWGWSLDPFASQGFRKIFLTRRWCPLDVFVLSNPRMRVDYLHLALEPRPNRRGFFAVGSAPLQGRNFRFFLAVVISPLIAVFLLVINFYPNRGSRHARALQMWVEQFKSLSRRGNSHSRMRSRDGQEKGAAEGCARGASLQYPVRIAGGWLWLRHRTVSLDARNSTCSAWQCNGIRWSTHSGLVRLWQRRGATR